MNRVLVYFLGIFTGVVLTFIVLLSLAKISSSYATDRVNYFSESKMQKMDVQSFQVFQVLRDGNALATCLTDAEYSMYLGPVVLLLSEDEMHFYDDQTVSAPKGKKYMQVGTYRYEAKNEMVKTVPAVALR